jgi:peptidyl-prolyl cis-trans isomerase B (cyclophilin B)
MAIIALVLAIAGFIVCGIFLSPLAAYLGYRVRNQIDRTGAQGRGLATAAIVVGIVGFLLNLVVVIVVITSPDFLSDLEGALT